MTAVRPGPSDEQAMIRDQARRALAQQPLAERHRRLLETRGDFDRELWRMCADLGWTAIAIPERFGGLGMGRAELAVIAEELGRALGSVPLVPSLAGAAAALLDFGSDAQRERWLPQLASGAVVGALCPDAGSGPGLRIGTGGASGALPLVCAAAFADLLVAPAIDADGTVALVLVDLSGAGVERTPVDSIDNSRGYAQVRLDGASAERLPGADDGAMRRLLARVALAAASEQIGGADACLYGTRDFVLQRLAFGQPIGGFQGVKHRLADIYALVEVARGNVAAALAAPDADIELPAAAARLSASRAYEVAAQEAIHLHGGIGITWEADWHLHHRRARAMACDWQGSAYWRDRIVDILCEAEVR